MRRVNISIGGLSLAAVAACVTAWAAECRHGSCTSCTGPELRPRCTATWDEAKTKKPEYAMKSEYACARARDSWHAPDPECRCSPPGGAVYVKKRLYKTEGAEKVERVPKYEVQAVPAGPCGCAACGGSQRGWDPLGLLFPFHHR
jgi:hypothetical protein